MNRLSRRSVLALIAGATAVNAKQLTTGGASAPAGPGYGDGGFGMGLYGQ